MEKRGALIFFIFLLAIGFVQASTLEVNLLTLEDHILDMTFLDAEGNTLTPYYHFYNNTGDGTFSFIVNEDCDSYDINCFLIKEGETIVHKRFNGVSSNQRIQILFVPGSQELTENYQKTAGSSGTQSANTSGNYSEEEIESGLENNSNLSVNIPEEENNENKSSASIGGFAIFDKAIGFFSTKFFYYLGLAVLFLLILFVLYKKAFKNKIKTGRILHHRDKEEQKKAGIILNQSKEKSSSLEDAEEKIKEAEKEIQELKNKKNKIDEAKKKLIDDQKELMKLREEEKEDKESQS